jgi:DNA mismatch endonuclease, patch repair protein
MPPRRRSGLPEVARPEAQPGLGGSASGTAHPPPKVRRPAVWHGVTDAIRRTMQSNRGKDTAPERTLRSMVHSMGYRFRKHVRTLPGTPDLVFPLRRKAIWLHGCFWHSHPGCRFATVPRTRADYWRPKLEQNRARDALHVDRLGEMGWKTLVVWECELNEDPARVRVALRRFLGPTGSSGSSHADRQIRRVKDAPLF